MSQPRISYILNSRWPTIKAYGLQVAKTCQGLVQVGAQVTLVAPRRLEYREIAGVDPLALYGIHERFPVVRLPSLDVTRSAFLFNIQQTLFALVALVRFGFKKDIIYTRDPFTAYLFSFVHRRVFWESHRFPGDMQSRFYRGMMARVAGIVVITQGLKKLFMERGVAAERIAVIADAVDPKEFDIPQTKEQARSELVLPSGREIIAYVGQLSTLGEEKGVGDLLEAFAKLYADRPQALLLIVGGNKTDIADYKRLTDKLELGAAVLFAGHQPHEKIPRYLRAADVLAMPFPNTEHYAHYMSPLKLFEYLAAGKPIVTTDLPSVREVVSDEDVYFVRANNTDALSEGLVRALTDTAASQEKSHRALAVAVRHSWQARADAIVNFINRQ